MSEGQSRGISAKVAFLIKRTPTGHPAAPETKRLGLPWRRRTLSLGTRQRKARPVSRHSRHA